MHDLDPIARFGNVFARASAAEPFDASRAALATADAHGIPSVRFVLVKEFDAEGFVFYTNRYSQKGAELAANPHAALSFHWASTGDQVRIAGAVSEVSSERADRYFASRPRGSQLGAWASDQSRAIASRAALLSQLADVERRFVDREVERPAHWTGFLIHPERIEFWHDQRDRMHDRTLYTRSGTSYVVSLLAP